MHQLHGILSGRRGRQSLVHCGHDAVGNDAFGIHPETIAQILLLFTICQQVWRQVAGRGALGQQVHLDAIALGHSLSHVMPKVGRDCPQAFVTLRGTGQVHNDACQLVSLVSGEQQVDRVVVAGLETDKVGPVRSAIHPCCAIGVDSATAPSHCGVSETARYAARLPVGPSGSHDLGELHGKPLAILIGVHKLRVILRFIIHAAFHTRSVVGVCAVHGKLKPIQARAAAVEFSEQIRLEPVIG